MVYYNAYITGEYNALYTPTNQGFFIAQVFDQGANQKFHCLIMIGICCDAQYRRVLGESWADFVPLYELPKTQREPSL